METRPEEIQDAPIRPSMTLKQPLITENEIENFSEDLAKIGFSEPDGASFLPINWQHAKSFEELLHAGDIGTLRKLARLSNVPLTLLEPPTANIPKQSNHSADWVGPTLLLTYGVVSNPNLVNIYLNLISSYLYEKFGTRKKEAQVHFSLVVEKRKKKKYVKLTYEGPLEGLQYLPKAIKRATK